VKIYISSTYVDLQRHRAAAAMVLRRMGHQVIGMEEYVAEGQRPLERCLEDVANCDAYVGILAWRYGHVPKGKPPPSLTLPPGTSYGATSITEFEFRHALALKEKPALMFVLDPTADWPSNQFDALSPGRDRGAAISKLRQEVGENHLVSYFGTPESLAGLVSAAVYRAEMSKQLKLESLDVDERLNNPIVRNGPVGDSTIGQIKSVIADPEEIQALQIHIGQGRDWWMSRLFFLSSLAVDLRSIQVMVFVGEDDAFVGIVDPQIVKDRLAAHDQRFARYERALARDKSRAPDVFQEVERRAAVWTMTMPEPEDAHPVFVTRRDLRRWLGAYMIDQAVDWDARTNAAMQVQRLLDWPMRFVPVVEDGKFQRVVDKQALSEQVARLFVREQVARAMTTV
jgi:uncharacterized protein DUF4062